MSGAQTLWDDGQTGAIKVSADMSNVIYSSFLIVNMTCGPFISPRKTKRHRFNVKLHSHKGCSSVRGVWESSSSD